MSHEEKYRQALKKAHSYLKFAKKAEAIFRKKAEIEFQYADMLLKQAGLSRENGT